MPAQIAHILLGLEASDALPFPPSRLDLPAFWLGCQGPDLFYHNRHRKPGAFLYGTRLHRRGWGTFLDRLRRQALERGWAPDHPGTAFLAGQATHGALDRWGHPFIVYFSGWRVPRHPDTEVLAHAHAFLERILDVRLWEQRRRRPWSECPWQDEFPGPEHFPLDFWDAWAEALHGVFPQLSDRFDVEARLRNAVSDTRSFLAWTSPSARDHGVKAARAGALHWFHPEALPDWDFLNLGHETWLEPVTGEPRTESFLDLYEGALREARGILATFGDPEADWESLIGNGSLNLPGPEGENRGPQHSRPWDYGGLYDREVKARLGAPGPL